MDQFVVSFSMIRTAITLVVLLFVTMSFLGCGRNTHNLKVVTGFSLDRYLGKWYEIARYPHSFEKGLSRVTATYTLREDGKIDVLNQGYNAAKGKWSDARGKAKFAGSQTEGHLRVSFFGPFYADYKIIALADDYSWAIVTSSSYNYFWILARQPRLEKALLEELITRSGEFGFDRARMEFVEQQ
ncbi:MAG: lipocalin family protein [Planctomycetota bacterium]